MSTVIFSKTSKSLVKATSSSMRTVQNIISSSKLCHVWHICYFKSIQQQTWRYFLLMRFPITHTPVKAFVSLNWQKVSLEYRSEHKNAVLFLLLFLLGEKTHFYFFQTFVGLFLYDRPSAVKQKYENKDVPSNKTNDCLMYVYT